MPAFSERQATLVSGVALLVLLSSGGAGRAQDLCAGLVADRAPHPLTALARPATGQAAVDPQFGTTIRRISGASAGGQIVPMYSTMSAWNADETRLILYQVGAGHRLHDGKTYAYIRNLNIDPNDVEEVYWHTSDPDVLFFPSGNRFYRYHVSTDSAELVSTFSFCTGAVHVESHGYSSWDSRVVGMRCESPSQSFFFTIDTKVVSGRTNSSRPAPLAAPSGTLGYWGGDVVDTSMHVLRTLDVAYAAEHASCGRLANGHDTYNAIAFDDGPAGSGVGSLVTYDLNDGSARVIIGPATGYPYPPSLTHVSAVAYKRPGWVALSIVGNPAGQGVLDQEIVLADTNPGGKVCRVAHHRSWARDGAFGYWGEPHAVISPSGTRILFASDWGNASSVDSYVVELPAYGTTPTPTVAPWHSWFAVDTLETPMVGDFDGDGKTDIITFTRQNPLAVGDVYVALSDGTNFGNNTKWHDWFAISADETVAIGDYDGDGKDDIATWLRTTTRQIYVAKSYGTGMTPETVWLSSIGSDPTDVILAGDVNGDGKDDLVDFARKQGKVYVALSTGTGFQAPAPWHSWFAVSTYERPRVADVNGDRRADIVTFATDSPTAKGDVYVALSDGTKFGDNAKWHDWFAVEQNQQIRIGDVDGDGREDFFTFMPAPMGQCYTVKSSGTAMGNNVLWPEPVGAGARDQPFVGDANGDGRVDVIVFAQGEGKVYVSVAP